MFNVVYKYLPSICKQIIDFLSDFKNSKIIILVITKTTVTFTLLYFFINNFVPVIESSLITWKQFEGYILNVLLHQSTPNSLYHNLLFKLLAITKFFFYKPLLYIYYAYIKVDLIMCAFVIYGFDTSFHLIKLTLQTTFIYTFFCEKLKDCFLSLIFLHTIIVTLFAFKQINYKTTYKLINILLLFMFFLVTWFLYLEINFTLNTNFSLHNTFFLLK